jgi:hypothetical protein
MMVSDQLVLPSHPLKFRFRVSLNRAVVIRQHPVHKLSRLRQKIDIEIVRTHHNLIMLMSIARTDLAAGRERPPITTDDDSSKSAKTKCDEPVRD